MADPRFLLDSNICIYLLEGLSDKARSQVERRAPGELITSMIVYAEVMRGLREDDARGRALTDAFFEVVPVVPFDKAAALAFRRVPFRRGGFDRLIAAHALALDLTLITNNPRDFADIAGLRVENWTE